MNKTDAVAVLPCPHCGGNAEVAGGYDGGAAAVVCMKCNAYGPSLLGKEEAIAAWNLRTSHVADGREVELLGSLLARIHRDGGHHQQAVGTDQAVVEADNIVANLYAERAAIQSAGEAVGWLYDWTHSSALGKPDEHFTSFTAKREDAFKPTNTNQRQVCLAAPISEDSEATTRNIGAVAPQKAKAEQAPDYSDMSREALERHAARMAQALTNEKPRQFYDKYATGPMMAPSCLCCGKLPDTVAIHHAELPGIVICKACADASRAPAATSHTPEHIERVLGKGEAGEEDALDASTDMRYPIIGNPHASIRERVGKDRSAYRQGWLDCIARTAPASATSAPSDADIAKVAERYSAFAGGGQYDITRYECEEDFYSCVRACIAIVPTSPEPRGSIAEDAEFLRLWDAYENSNSFEYDGAKAALFKGIDTIIKGGGNG